MRVHPRQADASVGGEVTQPPRGGVPVHAGTALVEQQRAGEALASGAVHRAAHRGWQRDEDDLATLVADPQHPVAVFLAQVVDVGADGLEDPQAEQAYEREVELVARLSRGGEQGLELQVRQPEGR